MEGQELNIKDVCRILKRRWKLITIITSVLVIITAIISFFVIKPKYESSIKVFIGKEGNITDKNYSTGDIEMYQKLMKTYGEIITTSDLIESALAMTSLKVEDVLENLKVIPSADTQILQIKYTSENPNEALEVVTAINDEFMIKSKTLIPNGNVRVIEEAKMPKKPVSPNKKLNIAIALLLGLMISIGISFLLEYLDSSFKEKDDLERVLKLPVIGVIPNYSES